MGGRSGIDFRGWFAALSLPMWVACTGELADVPVAGTTGAPAPATQLGAPGQLGLPGQPAGASAVGGGPDVAVSCAAAAPTVGPAPLRRLSRVEYQQTLQQLFQRREAPDVTEVPQDAEHEGFTSYAELQTLSAQHLRAYLQIASSLTTELLADPGRRAAVIGCPLEQDGCLGAFVSRFARLAYRRPVTTQEVDTLVTAAQVDAADSSEPFAFVLEAMLISPNFLFRVELGSGGETATLSSHEIASRLSFAAQGVAPSAELLERAEQGKLDSAQDRAQWAQVLADDPATHAYLAHFFAEWLGFADPPAPREPPGDWSEALLPDIAAETTEAVSAVAWAGGDFFDLLTSNQTWLTPRLASFYDLPAVEEAGWVTIPEAHPRAHSGVLTHASLIGAKGDGERIAKRGNWLRRTFMCQNLTIPPAVAETFGERLAGLTRTQIVQERNRDAACSGCHAQIDPIGIGFEAFDDTGRYAGEVDLSAFGLTPALPGVEAPAFTRIADLAEKLRSMPALADCLTERVFLFLYGREPTPADQCAVARAAGAFRGSGHDFRVLLQTLLSAPEFTLRRAPASPASTL